MELIAKKHKVWIALNVNACLSWHVFPVTQKSLKSKVSYKNTNDLLPVITHTPPCFSINNNPTHLYKILCIQTSFQYLFLCGLQNCPVGKQNRTYHI